MIYVFIKHFVISIAKFKEKNIIISEKGQNDSRNARLKKYHQPIDESRFLESIVQKNTKSIDYTNNENERSNEDNSSDDTNYNTELSNESFYRRPL